MTTLQEYLAAGAVEDVREFLAKPSPQVGFVEGGRGSFRWSRDDGRRVWTWIAVVHSSSTGGVVLSCYYRQTDSGFIVSDCGETVSEVMRRTGETWRESLAFVHLVECGGALETERPADIYVDDADDLAQAIVTVLSLVAKVRSQLDKEQS